MDVKNIKIDNLELGESKKPEHFYLEIQLEDQGQDFITLQLDKEGKVIGAQPFFSLFCQNLEIKIDSIILNFYPHFKRNGKSSQLKYKIEDYNFLLPAKSDFLHNGKSAFIGSFERFEDIGICEDAKLNLDINNLEEVKDFCVNEADAWFNGYKDDSKENRLLFAKILLDKLIEKYK